MLKNLRARGCPLAGAAACQSLESQENRLELRKLTIFEFFFNSLLYVTAKAEIYQKSRKIVSKNFF